MSDQALFETTTKRARLSADGRYRYELHRRWDDRIVRLTWVMLNPSVADADRDDPTIQRCMTFARALGYGGITVVNLYALISTDPAGLWSSPDPVGPDNDATLSDRFEVASAQRVPVIAAWGANARPDRVEVVVDLARRHGTELTALGVTLAGAPKHPLARGLHRIPDDAVPVPWPANNLDTQETR